MICWEALYVQTFHQQKVLITKQQVSETISLFVLEKITLTHSKHIQSKYLPALETTHTQIHNKHIT